MQEVLPGPSEERRKTCQKLEALFWVFLMRKPVKANVALLETRVILQKDCGTKPRRNKDIRRKSFSWV